MISALGETTGVRALQKQHEIMMSSEEGQHILHDKPRINSKTVDLNALRNLPENTFGYTYITFLEENVSFISYLLVLFATSTSSPSDIF